MEKDVKSNILVVSRLEKVSLNEKIRAELGKDREETLLAHLFELLKKQSNGELGPLLINGFTNIFYIRDANGNLLAVYVRWDTIHLGWSIGAGSVMNSYSWGIGCQVFSYK